MERTSRTLQSIILTSIEKMKKLYSFVLIIMLGCFSAMAEKQQEAADLARSGITARDNGKVDDALRLLYRSYVLLQSLPDPSSVKEKVDGQERSLATWIPEAMRDIIGKVSFGVASVRNDEEDPTGATKLVELTVRYDGQPATTCSFRYAAPDGPSPLITARDGMALLQLPPEGWQALGKPWQIRVLKRQALANKSVKNSSNHI